LNLTLEQLRHVEDLGQTPVIVGPTAGGKTALAIWLAQSLRSRGRPAEVVTADAFQVYRGMDIGTAKPTPQERAGIVHHLIDIVEPRERFTASEWLARATATIADCRERGVVPIVVGGTHLYVKLLLDGMFEGPGADEAMRELLRAMEPRELRAELERVDPAAAERLHPNDLRRTIRAIEVFRLTGTPISEHQAQWDTGEPESASEFTLIGIDWPTDAINRRINARVRLMMERGLLDEVVRLRDAGAFADVPGTQGNQAREALGYKQILAYLGRRCSLTDAVERIKIDTRRLGKAQRTWLRRLRPTPGSVWVDGQALIKGDQATGGQELEAGED
jgi:tRNA dimethylallyltransferase